jgi:hypothetical protein
MLGLISDRQFVALWHLEAGEIELPKRRGRRPKGK